MHHQFVQDYYRIKNQNFINTCYRLVQIITLIFGLIAFFIHKESILLALLVYFIIELLVMRNNPAQSLQKLIESQINCSAELLKAKAAIKLKK